METKKGKSISKKNYNQGRYNSFAFEMFLQAYTSLEYYWTFKMVVNKIIKQSFKILLTQSGFQPLFFKLGINGKIRLQAFTTTLFLSQEFLNSDVRQTMMRTFQGVEPSVFP